MTLHEKSLPPKKNVMNHSPIYRKYSKNLGKLQTQLIPVERQIKEEEFQKLFEAITDHFLFKEITEDVLKMLFKEMVLSKFNKDEFLYSEGTEGLFFYILAKGHCQILKKNKQVDVISPWTCFGETSLISKSLREESVKSLTEVYVYVLEGHKFRMILKEVNDKKVRGKFEIMNKISIFSSLDNGLQYNIVQQMREEAYDKGEQIIKQGEVADSIYIIKQGSVRCSLGGRQIATFYKNDFFGENAILLANITKNKRACDVFINDDDTKLYCITVEEMKTALGPNFNKIIIFSLFKDIMAHDRYFKAIALDSVLEKLFPLFSVKKYSKNDKIENFENKCIIVIAGNVLENGKLIGSKGDLIGPEKLKKLMDSKEQENSPISFLEENQSVKPNANQITVQPDLTCLEADVEKIAKILNAEKPNPKKSVLKRNFPKSTNLLPTKQEILKKPTKVTKKESKKSVKDTPDQTPRMKVVNIAHRISKLKKIYLFKHLSEKTLEQIAMNLERKTFILGSIIIKEETYGDAFYLISKGKVRITQKDELIRELEPGNCFGEIALISDQEKRTATVTAIEKTTCYILSKKSFDLIIDDDSIIDYLQKKISLQNTAIGLEDLYIIKALGKGKFGNVHLVHNMHNLYAIKAVSREDANHHTTLAEYFCRERRIMLTLDHPFVVQIVKTLKNENFCFFLLEYVNGTNFDQYLSKKKHIRDIEECKFYFAIVLLILRYLHKKKIIHRDIKPSNIMMDSNGYLKLIDFGTARICKDYSNSVIGTPYYIAPEVLNGKEYNISCDYWSAAVMLYEMFYGIYPFGNNATQIIQIYKEINIKKVSFPAHDEKTAKINGLLKDMLKKDINLRVYNFEIIQTYPFFENIEWDEIIDFKVKPPFVPNSVDYSFNLKPIAPYEKEINRLAKKIKPVSEEMSRWANEF